MASNPKGETWGKNVNHKCGLKIKESSLCFLAGITAFNLLSSQMSSHTMYFPQNRCPTISCLQRPASNVHKKSGWYWFWTRDLFPLESVLCILVDSAFFKPQQFNVTWLLYEFCFVLFYLVVVYCYLVVLSLFCFNNPLSHQPRSS